MSGSLQSLAAPYATALPMPTSLPGAASLTAQSSEDAGRSNLASGLGVSQSLGNKGAAARRANCKPVGSVQSTQLGQQQSQGDEWILSDDENDCQQAAAGPSLAQDAEMAQLLEMGFTPRQAVKVSSCSTSCNASLAC